MPPALMAATPVGATTTNCFSPSALIACKNVVLPLPALPVKNRLRSVLRTKSNANSNSGFVECPIVSAFWSVQGSRRSQQAFAYFFHGSHHPRKRNRL